MRRARLVLGLAVVLGALLATSAGYAQQTQRIVVLTPSHGQWYPGVFREALAEVGYRDGVNIKIEVVSAEGRLELLPKLAQDIVQTAPDVIVAVNTPTTRAVADATTRIPIVSAGVADPVALGIVKSLARPEGNITGIANMASDITTKRVALLKEVVPAARRFALFMHPDEPVVPLQVRDIEASAPSLGIEFKLFPMRTLPDLQQAFELAKEWKADAIVRLAGQGFTLGADTGKIATAMGLPSMLQQKRDVEAGGLMSYFADQRESWRKVALHTGRILKGASPRDLPFELPTRFEFAINLKTAKALGLELSPSLLARADEVVE